MQSDNAIQIPLPTEHAYHMGWTSYQHNLPQSSNPYNEIDESELHVAWMKGYNVAKLVDKQ